MTGNFTQSPNAEPIQIRDRVKELHRVRASELPRGGIYGNDAIEATYPLTKTLSDGEPLDGSKHNYTLTFSAGQLPRR
jgi:hypothetical protein